MWLKLIFVLTILSWLGSGNSNYVHKNKKDYMLNKYPSFDIASYDRDYGIQPRRPFVHYQKSNEVTTERPLIRYWNNFVRTVRLSMPNITWNVTNPIRNLLNAGASAFIDTPVPNHQSSGSGNSPNRRGNKRKRKNSNHITNRYPIDELNPHDQHQIISQGYPNLLNADGSAMFYYDPNTQRYYEVQMVNNNIDNKNDYYGGYYNSGHSERRDEAEEYQNVNFVQPERDEAGISPEEDQEDDDDADDDDDDGSENIGEDDVAVVSQLDNDANDGEEVRTAPKKNKKYRLQNKRIQIKKNRLKNLRRKESMNTFNYYTLHSW